jgi:hypothetical protein
MTCRKCGVEIPEGCACCIGCGAAVDPVQGDTKQHGNLGSTVIFGDTRVMENIGATRIYQEKDLGKTVIYKPVEQRKPIYGWLVVTEGPDAWKDFRIADEEVQLFLGKGEECQLQLQDSKLEKIHASIRIKDGNLTITDFDTTAGTFVNDKTVTRIELQDGDTVKVGESVLRFRKC